MTEQAIHQSPHSDKPDPREGVGLDTVQLRLDLAGQALDTWRVPPPVYGPRRSWYRPASHVGTDWSLRHAHLKGTSIAVRLWSVGETRILGGALYIRCEVSRLAACDAEPDAGPWPNNRKVTPDDARDLLLTFLVELERAVDAAELFALPCEVTRIDVFADVAVADVRAAVAACSVPPIVRGRAPLPPTRHGETGVTLPRTPGRSLEGGRTSPRTQATRVYSRGDKPGAPAADAGVVRYEAEHGTGAHGSAATPIEYDPPEHLPDLPVRPVSKWTTREGEVCEALSLETALDPALWIGILAARLLEQGLTPGLRPGGDDLAAFANALIRDGIRPDQASFYAMIASGRLEVSDRTARATRRRVESKTSLRWGAAAESFPEKVWQLLKEAKESLKETKLSETKFRKNFAQILALDPDHCAGAQIRREAEREIASALVMPGAENIARVTRDILSTEDEDPQDSPTRCLLPAPRREEETEEEEEEEDMEPTKEGPARDPLEPSSLPCSSDLLNPFDLRNERPLYQGETGARMQRSKS